MDLLFCEDLDDVETSYGAFSLSGLRGIKKTKKTNKTRNRTNNNYKIRNKKQTSAFSDRGLSPYLKKTPPEVLFSKVEYSIRMTMAKKSNIFQN